MLLKTFIAPDLAAALARARGELGPGALVLATREVTGRLGLTSVEVTVAVERPGGADGTDSRSSGTRIRPRGERSGERSTASAGRGADVPGPARVLGLDALLDEDPALASSPALRAAAWALVDGGLSEDLVARFARIAARDARPDGGTNDVAQAAEKGIAGIIPFAPIPNGRRCLILVGPPGSGKTTTVAKLAARAAGRTGQPVVFAAADGERIGSMEQAAVFSRCVGARLAPIETPDDLARAIAKAGSRGRVFVDTPGVGAGDVTRLDYLRALRRRTPDAAVAVLVPAGVHCDEAARILRRFRVLEPSCVAFSRVDDGGRIGELVTALEPTRLPLSFVTTGHDAPDLEEASPRGVAAMMLRAGLSTGRGREIPA